MAEAVEKDYKQEAKNLQSEVDRLNKENEQLRAVAENATRQLQNTYALLNNITEYVITNTMRVEK